MTPGAAPDSRSKFERCNNVDVMENMSKKQQRSVIASCSCVGEGFCCWICAQEIALCQEKGCETGVSHSDEVKDGRESS